MGAATLDTAETAETGDDSSSFRPPDDSDDNVNPNPGTPDGRSDEEIMEGQDRLMAISTCIPFLSSPLGIGLVFVGFLAIVGLVYRQFNAATAMLAGWTLFPPIMLVYFLMTNCGGQSWGSGSDSVEMSDPGQAPVQPVTDMPAWLLVAIVGVVFVGAAVLLYRSAGGDETVTIQEPEENGPELDQFAAAAGQAADRIEKHNEGIDNSVYQAWIEMTDILNVENSKTYSAGEFAEEAIGLGMAKPDVEELTRLFNEVRYGGKDAETREERAIGVLRTIESQYAEPTGHDRVTDTTMEDDIQ